MTSNAEHPVEFDETKFPNINFLENHFEYAKRIVKLVEHVGLQRE